jgi:hypothetical protein
MNGIDASIAPPVENSLIPLDTILTAKNLMNQPTNGPALSQPNHAIMMLVSMITIPTAQLPSLRLPSSLLPFSSLLSSEEIQNEYTFI